MFTRNSLLLVVAVVLLVLYLFLFSPFARFRPARQSAQNGQNGQSAHNAKLNVVGTFYPLAHFAQQIGGSYVNVENITPAGAEPHDYEPTPQDIVKSYSAQVFIMNGGGVDTWAEKIEPDLRTKGIIVLKMSDNIKFIPAQSDQPDQSAQSDQPFQSGQQTEPGQPAKQGQETSLDPHIWLDPVNAQLEAGLIEQVLIQADPAHKQDYQNNSAQYTSQLQDLDQQYKTGLASCQQHDIVTSHAALGYMAKRYGFNQIAIAGLSPDAEPSAQKLTEISQAVAQKHIKYVFFETLVSPKLSETIANETGAKTIAFNPLEGLTDQEIISGKTYISVMLDNLSALRIALECK